MAFMDVIHDVCHSVVSKLYDNFEAYVMSYGKLKVGEECDGNDLKCGMICFGQIHVPLCNSTNEGSLEEIES